MRLCDLLNISLLSILNIRELLKSPQYSVFKAANYLVIYSSIICSIFISVDSAS